MSAFGGSEERGEAAELHFRALVAACKGGFMEIVRLLLADGRIDAGAAHNRALVAATCAGKAEVVAYLLRRRDVSVNGISSDDMDDEESLFFMAISGGHTDVVRVLLNDGRLDPQHGCHAYRIRSALGYAANKGHTDIMRLMLSSGRIKSLGCRKDALLEAVLGDAFEAVKLMLSLPGIHPACAAHYGTPLIHTAMSHGEGNALRALLADSRSDLHEPDECGYTPLRAAVKECRISCVAVLLADPRVDVHKIHRPFQRKRNSNRYGDPYDDYIGYDSEDVYLSHFRPSQYDRPHSSQFDLGEPLLHLAVRSGRADTVRLLLADPRIDPRAKDAAGCEAIMPAPVLFGTEPPERNDAVVAAMLADPRVHPADDAAAPAFYARALLDPGFAGKVFLEDVHCGRMLRVPLPDSVRPNALGASRIVRAAWARAWRRRHPVIAARVRLGLATK